MEPDRGATLADAHVIAIGEATDVARALAPLLPPSLVPVFGASFIRSGHLYDEFVARLALRVVHESGLEAALRESGITAELVARAGLAGARALTPVDWLLRKLAARGLLEAAGEPARFRAPGALPDLDPAPLRDEQLREDPSWLPSYVLAETVAKDYPAFLRGERTGEELLFSPARLRLWVDFFSNANGLYAVNNLVGAEAAQQWLPPGPVRVLELGAGLGSAAIALLDRLRDVGRWDDIVEYRFTDIVPAFMRRGRDAVEKRCPEARFLHAETLDMNRPFAEQGVAPGTYSLVYAVNAVHVARDLDRTFREIRSALTPGGVLVLGECVRLEPGHAVYAEFVFNLLESFRSPVLHPRHRPNGGFLTPGQWRGGMEASGFANVRFLPDVDRIRAAFPNFYVMAIAATRP